MKIILIIFSLITATAARVQAAIEIDGEDKSFLTAATKELDLIREGKRGLAPQVLVERLDAATAKTLIKPVTDNENTWHPNDRKGTRSHVIAQDTKIQGAERTQPTEAVIYVHPSRVDSHLSLFKLGTFVHLLALAADLNTGQFPADYKLRERRATFFSNAWRDALGYTPVTISDNVPTVDYQKAKQKELLTPENKDAFPILE